MYVLRTHSIFCAIAILVIAIIKVSSRHAIAMMFTYDPTTGGGKPLRVAA